MGDYQGSGIVSGGGSSTNVFETRLWYGFHTCYQKKTTVNTVYPGVGITRAQQEIGAISMSDFFGGNYPNGIWRRYSNAKGTQKSVSYSQINGSNLYELSVTNDSIAAKEDNGGWSEP